MVQTERSQEKVAFTKLCFYCKQNEKWKLVLKIQPNGSDKKDIRKRG